MPIYLYSHPSRGRYDDDTKSEAEAQTCPTKDKNASWLDSVGDCVHKFYLLRMFSGCVISLLRGAGGIHYHFSRNSRITSSGERFR